MIWPSLNPVNSVNPANNKGNTERSYIGDDIMCVTTSIETGTVNNYTTKAGTSINYKDNYHKGFTQKENGYILIYKPNHKRSDNKGYVPEHTLIMEKHLGRLLKDNELVHHINNKNISNLKRRSYGFQK